MLNPIPFPIYFIWTIIKRSQSSKDLKKVFDDSVNYPEPLGFNTNRHAKSDLVKKLAFTTIFNLYQLRLLGIITFGAIFTVIHNSLKTLVLSLIPISCLFLFYMFTDIFFHICPFVFFDNNTYFSSCSLYLRKFQPISLHKKYLYEKPWWNSIFIQLENYPSKVLNDN